MLTGMWRHHGDLELRGCVPLCDADLCMTLGYESAHSSTVPVEMRWNALRRVGLLL